MFREVITDANLIALPANLLYLYFVGAWYDLNKLIEIAELVLLGLVIIFGIYRFKKYLETELKQN